MPTVMVIEDMSVMRDTIARLLKREGYSTLTAESGLQALEQLEYGGASPDAILLDIMMPDLDGLELLERLHTDSRWKGVPVIMLSAISDTHTIHRAEQLGAKAYLIKATFSVTEMMSEIRKCTQYIPH